MTWKLAKRVLKDLDIPFKQCDFLNNWFSVEAVWVSVFLCVAESLLMVELTEDQPLGQVVGQRVQGCLHLLDRVVREQAQVLDGRHSLQTAHPVRHLGLEVLVEDVDVRNAEQVAHERSLQRQTGRRTLLNILSKICNTSVVIFF